MDSEIFATDYSSEGFISSTGDIGLVTGYDNAVQSIRNRLLTRLGTYPSIDSEYGSEIHKIIGEKATSEKLAELELYVRDVLLEEPRVYRITSLELHVVGLDSIMLELVLRLVDGSDVGFTETIQTLG